MLHKKTIFFLSPIPKKFHNKQITYFAHYLAKKYNVLYFDCSDIKVNSLSLFEIISIKGNFIRYIHFIKSTINQRLAFIDDPIIFTLYSYRNTGKILYIDKLLFNLQVNLISFIASGSLNSFIWTSTCDFPDIWRSLKWKKWIFDFFDRFSDSSARIKENEKWLIEKSELIFVSSIYYQKLAMELKNDKNKRNIVMSPIGYKLDKYLAKKPDKKKSKRITVGFEGGISDRLDFKLIISVIRANPEIDYIFVGPVYRNSSHSSDKPYSTLTFLKKLSQLPNARLVPYISDENKLVSIISEFHIGWIPYNVQVNFNKYSTPNKFYEYVATGLPVISTPLRVLEDYPFFVTFVNNPIQFKVAVEQILSKETKSMARKRKEFARENNIDKKYYVVWKELSKID